MSKEHDKLVTIKLTPENEAGVEARVKLYADAGLKVSFNSAANMALREGLTAGRVPNPEWETATHHVLLPAKPVVINIKRGKVKRK